MRLKKDGFHACEDGETGEITSRNARLTMAQSVLVELRLPGDWQRFRLPPALDDRLQELLDRQDSEGKLSARERREAKALVQLVDLLTHVKLRARLADGR